MKIAQLLCRHKYTFFSHCLEASNGSFRRDHEGTWIKTNAEFVIAWRQCNKCGKSKLVHILE